MEKIAQKKKRHFKKIELTNQFDPLIGLLIIQLTVHPLRMNRLARKSGTLIVTILHSLNWAFPLVVHTFLHNLTNLGY